MRNYGRMLAYVRPYRLHLTLAAPSLSTITNADRIVVLHEGQVVEQGAHAELLARQDSLYRHYHALQFQWDKMADGFLVR